MQPFAYVSPANTAEAVRALTEGSEVLAGGTDLLSLMKDYIATPKRLVSLKHLKELKGIEFKSGSGLRIGAMASLEELMENASVKEHYPALVQAAEGVSSPQIRSMGTVGGDLLQRPRCWYYRGGYGLLAMYGGKSLVPDGENRYHAILGNSGPAYFVNPSSFAPILIALGAKARVEGSDGKREIELEKFFVTPTAEGQRENALKPQEILTEILVPPPGGAKMAVNEVREKTALDWPLAAAAAVLQMDGETIKSAQVVLGHVAPVPWPSPEAAEALAGKSVSEEVADAAGKAAVSKATPLSKNGYKVQLARIAVKRAILNAAKGGA